MPETVPSGEEHPTNPISSYGIVKPAIEKCPGLFRHLYGLDYTVLRISNPYGPYQDPKGQQGAIIGVFLLRRRVHAGRPMSNLGRRGRGARLPLRLRPDGDALEQAAGVEPPERVLNIGSGRGTSPDELVWLMAEVVGGRPAAEYLPARALGVPASASDIGRAREELGWSPKTGLAEGIARAWDWICTLSESRVEF